MEEVKEFTKEVMENNEWKEFTFSKLNSDTSLLSRQINEAEKFISRITHYQSSLNFFNSAKRRLDSIRYKLVHFRDNFDFDTDDYDTLFETIEDFIKSKSLESNEAHSLIYLIQRLKQLNKKNLEEDFKRLFVNIKGLWKKVILKYFSKQILRQERFISTFIKKSTYCFIEDKKARFLGIVKSLHKNLDDENNFEHSTLTLNFLNAQNNYYHEQGIFDYKIRRSFSFG